MSSSKYSIVVRFQGMRPEQLARYELHRTRQQKDSSEIDPSRTHLNKLLIGSETWAKEALAEIDGMRMQNFARELEGLKKRKRIAEIQQRTIDGPKDPWRPSKHGPMREVILTAHADWFNAAGDQATWRGMMAKRRREKMFEGFAVSWLKKEFGENAIHARADRDEKTYHIHAVIMPRSHDKHGRPMLIPSKSEAIESYELAQTRAGDWFSAAGLERGRTLAADAKEAKKQRKKGPDPVHHKPTWKWRQETEVSIRAEHDALNVREAKIEERERELEAAGAFVEKKTTAIAAREVAVGNREVVAQSMADEADSVLAAAEGLADDLFTLQDTLDGARFTVPSAVKASGAADPLIQRLRKSNKGHVRARSAFGRAWSAMRARALGEAETRLREEFGQIVATREAFLDLVRKLPRTLRDQLGETWDVVTKKVIGLEIGLSRRGILDSESARPSRNPSGKKAPDEK